MGFERTSKHRGENEKYGEASRHEPLPALTQGQARNSLVDTKGTASSGNTHRSKLSSLLRRGGMRFGPVILRAASTDRFLFRKLQNKGIESKESLEHVLLELLFEARVLVNWSVTDDLVVAFTCIKDKLDWASDIYVEILIQLFHAVMRARLSLRGTPAFDQEPCAVADRVDQVVSWMNGADDLMEELENFVHLVIPLALSAHLRSKTKKGKKIAATHQGDMMDDGLVFRNGICMNAADVGLNTRRGRRLLNPPRGTEQPGDAVHMPSENDLQMADERGDDNNGQEEEQDSIYEGGDDLRHEEAPLNQTQNQSSNGLFRLF
ncbi:unnamed protein product [Discula destructiva]